MPAALPKAQASWGLCLTFTDFAPEETVSRLKKYYFLLRNVSANPYEYGFPHKIIPEKAASVYLL